MTSKTVRLASFEMPKDVPLNKIPVGQSFLVGGRLAHVVCLGGTALLQYEGAVIPPIGRPDDGRTFNSIRVGNTPGKSMKEE